MKVTVMDYYEAVASQPANLESSAQTVRGGLGGVDLQPWRNGQLAVVSIGASSHAANTLVSRLLRRGRRAVNLDASDVMFLGPPLDVADSYLFVSESGRSRETIAAAQLAPVGRRLGLTNDPAAPLSEVLDAVIGLGHGEDSRVYTVGYTATLQAFGLLATAIDGVDDGDDWAALPGLVRETLATLADRAVAVAESFVELSSIDFVGHGASFAAAAEGALLTREATRTSTATYATYQYLHGPMESLTPRQGCVLFGNDREVPLARFVADKGVPTVLITSGVAEEDENLSVLRIPAAAASSRAVLEILPVQLLVGELAKMRGLRIDGFLYHQDDTKIDKL
jgi:fructoselysine-6-P-deglycase FrlB-like protein